ncbi:MAG: VCBS repeat-containing protein, partial [Planctomycetes bacterium]|nr:VCBS repeat-containing protein [Planctomycetota bacterium]
SFPYSVSLGDLNGDGRPDLAVADRASDTVSVLFNTTASGAMTPSFSPKTDFVAGSAPWSVAIGDLNGDGRPDLAVANRNSYTVSVLFNTTAPGATTPSFAARTDLFSGSLPYSVAVADLNSDGRPDLIVANSNSNNVRVLINTTAVGASTPSFPASLAFGTGSGPHAVTIGDLNGDGRPDLAVANRGGNSVSVLFNTTAPGALPPSFSAKSDVATQELPASIAIGDLNSDGLPDLVVASSSVSVFLNTTAAGATQPSFIATPDFTAGSGPRSVTFGDLNGDGRPDLAVANYNSNSVSVLFNSTATGAATPSFSAKTDFATGSVPLSVEIGDLNGDGRPDLAVANRNSNTVSILFNTTATGAATPSFSAKTDFATGSVPLSVEIGDL